MKLYHIHRENKYDNLFEIGNTLEFGDKDNFLKESYMDICPTFTQIKTLEDGKEIKKYVRFDEALQEEKFQEYSRMNQMQLLKMVSDYVALSSGYNRENILEQVRKDMFPDRPSRYNCMFLTDEEGLDNWLNILKQNSVRFFYDRENPIDVYEVDADGEIFISTNKLLPTTDTEIRNMEFDAQRYWDPTPYEIEHSKCKEYLLKGTAKLIRKVK